MTRLARLLVVPIVAAGAGCATLFDHAWDQTFGTDQDRLNEARANYDAGLAAAGGQRTPEEIDRYTVAMQAAGRRVREAEGRVRDD
jgi:hypothetical protein